MHGTLYSNLTHDELETGASGRYTHCRAATLEIHLQLKEAEFTKIKSTLINCIEIHWQLQLYIHTMFCERELTNTNDFATRDVPELSCF